MPDTSRAARYVLKDYVNAKLLYAHAPPGVDADEFMSSSRDLTLAKLEEQYANGRKRAPETHVSKNADTYVAPAGSKELIPMPAEEEEGAGDAADPAADPTAPRERQATSAAVRRTAATAGPRSGKVRAAAFDGAFFTESGPAPRPVIKGNRQGAMEQDDVGMFSRQTFYPHQRRLGPDGMPLIDDAPVRIRNNGKKHYKHREGKHRSGRGYD
jgi:large subunit GTPase 1